VALLLKLLTFSVVLYFLLLSGTFIVGLEALLKLTLFSSVLIYY